jgi:hypothetical protein
MRAIEMKFRKKPVVIEAVQWTGEFFDCDDMPNWLIDACEGGDVTDGDLQSKTIATLEGDHRCSPGDWIIRGVKGELYPCKPDIFEATYERA